jgi:hypothetical protein
MAQRIRETLQPGLDALEALGSHVPGHQEIDAAVAYRYQHIAKSDRNLRELLKNMIAGLQSSPKD